MDLSMTDQERIKQLECENLRLRAAVARYGFCGCAKGRSTVGANALCTFCIAQTKTPITAQLAREREADLKVVEIASKEHRLCVDCYGEAYSEPLNAALIERERVYREGKK